MILETTEPSRTRKCDESSECGNCCLELEFPFGQTNDDAKDIFVNLTAKTLEPDYSVIVNVLRERGFGLCVEGTIGNVSFELDAMILFEVEHLLVKEFG